MSVADQCLLDVKGIWLTYCGVTRGWAGGPGTNLRIDLDNGTLEVDEVVEFEACHQDIVDMQSMTEGGRTMRLLDADDSICADVVAMTCVLSNFYPCAIAVDGVNFKSSEHAYQHAKAIFHGDGATAACVVGAKNGAEAKKYGRRTKLRRGGWSEARQDVMRRILQVKFSIPMLSAFLMSTGVAELIENVPSREGYWGLQIDRSAGQNKLGKLLMAIRAEVHGIAPLVHVPVLDVMPRVIPQVHHLCGLVPTPVGFLCPGGQLDKIDRVTTRVEFNGESLLYKSVQCKGAPLIEVTNKSEGPGSCGKVCHQDARPVGVLVGGYKDRIFFQVSGEPFGERVPQFPLFGPTGEERVRRALRAQGLGEIEAMEEVPFTPNGEMYGSSILTVRRGSFWLWALDQFDDLSAALAAEELSDLDSVAAIQRMAKDGVHRDVEVVATLETLYCNACVEWFDYWSPVSQGVDGCMSVADQCLLDVKGIWLTYCGVTRGWAGGPGTNLRIDLDNGTLEVDEVVEFEACHQDIVDMQSMTEGGRTMRLLDAPA